MSVGSGGLGTVYSRLPQSTSDVETSEDEVSQHENLIFYRKIGTPKKGKIKVEEEGKSTMKDYQPVGSEVGSVESHEVHINGFSNINYNYAHGTGENAIEEETMVMGPLGVSGTTKKKEGSTRHGNLQMLVGNRHPMSMMRQVAFVMSLCLCIFVIVAFLWVLPCNWSTCPIMRYNQQGSSWERTLRGLEVIGRISVVPSGDDYQNNLLFMVRGEISFPDRDKQTTQLAKPIQIASSKKVPTPIPTDGGGLVALTGLTGVVVWYKYLHSIPRDIDCSLVDFDGDGKTDCLLIGSNDLMYAFNPVAPTTIWFLHVEDTKYIPTDMEFPLVLPDIDGDNVLDLAIACRVLLKNSTDKTSSTPTRTPHNRIALVSGKTGQLLGKYFMDEGCQTLSRLGLDRKWSLSYRCVDMTGREISKEMNVMALFENVTGRVTPLKNEDLKNLKARTSIRQHFYPQSIGPPEYMSLSGEPRLRTGKPYHVTVAGRRLLVSNQGQCPENCRTTAQVFEEKRGSNTTLWTDGGSKMYALRPATLLFNSQTPGIKLDPDNPKAPPGTVSGFAVKFWHWIGCEKSAIWSSQRKQKRMIQEKVWDVVSQPKGFWHDGSSDPKPPDYVESRESRIGASGINTTTKSLSTNSSTVTVTYHPKEVYNKFCLKERIVLVTFNETDMHLVNASENEIKQLCSNIGCQPSLSYQEQSLMMADLDGDGSKELVSYLTSYEVEEDGKVPGSNRLILLSKVRVVRLEAELPKLYEAVTHL